MDAQERAAAPESNATLPAARKRLDNRERERLVLNAARQLLGEGGYSHLTMNRLAEKSGCTRKTVYNYFANIDDVVIALCIRSTAQRADMMARAITFKGRPRERLVAMGAVTRVLSRHQAHHELILSVNNIKEKTSPERQRELQGYEDRIITMGAGVVRDAIAVGDLELPPTLTPEQLMFSLHIMNLGTMALIERGFSLGSFQIENPLAALEKTANLLLDDLGWRPLSHEVNWEERMHTMWREVFPDLLAEAGESI